MRRPDRLSQAGLLSLDGVPDVVSGDVGEVGVGAGVDAVVLACGLDVPT